MKSIDKFLSYYKEEKNIINNRINRFNDELVKEDNLIIRSNLELFKNLNTDGKLVRGTLVNLGYYLLKEDKEYSIDLSLAYEVFQTAILVHDDIIDNDDKRRGKETVHYSNSNKYKTYSNSIDEVKNLGNNIAICIGDYGLYCSNNIIAKSYKDDKNLAKILINFNDTVLNTIKGELLDVILPFESKNEIVSNEEVEKYILEIYKLKTSHYTIIGPLTVGLLLAGLDDKEKENEISNFGEKVGIAFQIQDDLLGIYSNETGKVIASDIKEAKQTILYSYIYNTEYKDELLKYYGKDELTDSNIERVRELFDISGAKQHALNLMNKMYDESLDILKDIDWINDEKKELLEGFVEYLRGRNN